MTFKSYLVPPKCPFCESVDYCEHFIGWTNDGKRITETLDSSHEPGAIESISIPICKDTDRIVKTGVSARVYKKKLEVVL